MRSHIVSMILGACCLMFASGHSVGQPSPQSATTNSSRRSVNSRRPAQPGIFLIIDEFGRPHFFAARGRIAADQLRVIRTEQSNAERPVEQNDEDRVVIGAVLRPLPTGLHGLLGLNDGQGFLVTHVLESGPAAQAGIRENDLILKLGDQPVHSIPEFRDQLNEFGEVPIDVTIQRKMQSQTLSITPVRKSKIDPREVEKLVQSEAETVELSDASLPPLSVPRSQAEQLLELQKSVKQLRQELRDHQKHIDDVFKQLQAEIRNAE